jgi:glycosyltransferase involved in cell wall biosynthesis
MLDHLGISVVIPAFNVECWLQATIESVLRQSRAPDEIIVVDDGSTDSTGEIADGFGDVTVIRQENRGLAGARNSGASAAVGDYILFLDADDSLLPGALSSLDGLVEANPALAAVVPNHWIARGQRQRLAWREDRLRILDRADAPTLLRANVLAGNGFVRRDVWDALRFREDLRAVEDLDFWLRLLLGGFSIGLTAEPLVRKREEREGSLSSNLRLMRRSRKTFFLSLWSRHDLRPSERALVAFQIARTSVGVLVTPRPRQVPRAAAPKAEPRCLHVFLDEPGGGPMHVELLRAALGDQVSWDQVALEPGALRASPIGWLRSVRTVRERARAGAEVIHAHGVRAAAACALALVGRRGTAVVVTVHGLHSLRRSRLRSVRLANRAVLGRAARVLALSRSDAGALVAEGLVRADRVRTIRTSFVPARAMSRAAARLKLGLDAADVAVSWLGRLSEQKDPLTFVRAMKQVAPSVHALMAGDGPLVDEIQSAANVPGNYPRVRMLGWMPDPSPLLAASDVFVSSSRWEGLPLAVLEAAHAGVALVLTDVPGNRDLSAMGVPAILVPPEDPRALAAAVETLAKDPDRRREMGLRASEVVRERFTPEALAEDVLAVYRGLR